MSINIILSASQQSWNRCVKGDSEEDHTFIIAKKIAALLTNFDCNVFLIPKEIKGTESETLMEVVRQSNEFAFNNKGISYHLDLHTDGGYNGRGASGFYISENGKSFISIIHNEIAKITPWRDGNISWRELYVLKHTTSIAGLIEIGFHDKQDEAEFIHNKSDEISQAILNGLIRATGIQKKLKEEKKVDKFLQTIERDFPPERYDENISVGDCMKLFYSLYEKICEGN